MPKIRVRQLGQRVGFVVAILAPVLLLKHVLGSPVTPRFDGQSYYRIAQGVPLSDVAAPYRNRFLLPRFVSYVPDVELAFSLVVIASLVLIGLLSFELFEDLSNKRGVQYAGVAVVLLSPALLQYSIYYEFFLDAPSYVPLLVGAVAAIRARKFLLIVSVVIGIFIRPIVLTALVLYAAVHFSWPPTKEYVGVTTASLVGVLVALLLIRVVAGEGGYYEMELVTATLKQRVEHLDRTLFYVVSPFGIGWVYAGYTVLQWRHLSVPWLKRGLLTLPILCIQLLVANGWNRILFGLFPILVTASMAPFCVDNIRISDTLANISYVTLFSLATMTLALFAYGVKRPFLYQFSFLTFQTVPYVYLTYTR